MPRLFPMPPEALDNPSLLTMLKLSYNTIARLFHDPIGMILGSTFFLLMLWGTHGKLELLGFVWKDWKGPGTGHAPGQFLPGIPWDQEWLSFAIGVGLLVVVPAALIKLVYKQSLRDYGLGWPKQGRWPLTLLSAASILALGLVFFYLGSRNPAMQQTYPLFRDFEHVGHFIIYQMGYVLFFVAIEFIFRGYLLFGLFQFRDQEAPPGVRGESGPLVFGHYAIFISMLSYTAWHLGKPVVELWGTLLWGIAAGATVLACGTIWHVVLVHWLLNVVMDLLIWLQR